MKLAVKGGGSLSVFCRLGAGDIRFQGGLMRLNSSKLGRSELRVL